MTLSLPLMAARLGLALGPLGTNSWFLESAVVGFCGIEGCTPSTASQCAMIDQYVGYMRVSYHPYP